jgi:hypothetical protein
MWLYRSLLAILGGSCLVMLSATLTRTAASVTPTAPPPPEITQVPPAPAPQPDAAAERDIDLALDALKPERVSWLELAIWQKVQLPGYTYEANGTYRLAPGQRFRMEMRTHLGESEGTLLMVSDGRDLWQAVRPGEGAWENVTRLNLSEVFSVMNGPSGPKLRDEFLQRPHFQGMTPLLRNLRQRLIWARSATIHRGEAEQIHLVAVWPKEDAAKLAPPEKPWPTGLPRQCHLYLDARTYWAQRLEWWGPTAAAGADRLQVQMEFRNPIVNRPLPAEACARLFAFQPGDASIEDETARVMTEMTKRAGELTAQAATH